MLRIIGAALVGAIALLLAGATGLFLLLADREPLTVDVETWRVSYGDDPIGV